MIVQYIDGFTNVLGEPKDWNREANGEVFGLPVRIEQHGDTVSCTSAWKPSPDELTALLTGANINLRVVGGQPPVMVFIDDIAEDTAVAAPSATEQRMLLMAKVLRMCASQFSMYALLHSAKGTPEGNEKAATNSQFAKVCKDVLEGVPADIDALRPKP